MEWFWCPACFLEEVHELVEANVFHGKPASQFLKISENTHVILPIHKKLDELREKKARGSKGEIGTTVRGIGPSYEDKVARRGVHVRGFIKTCPFI